MDYIFANRFTWKELVIAAFILGVIYFILYLVQQLNKRSSLSGRFQKRMDNLFRQIFIVYELMTMLVLAGVFLFINPVFHGFLLLFVVAGSYPYIRSYISGRWVYFDNVITEGIEMKTNNLQGVVSKMGRIRLDLQTNEGLHHLSYNRLLTDGYTLVSGEEIGGFYYFELSPKESTGTIKNHRLHLMDLFATAPYIDWNHKPELFRDDDKPNVVDARILIKEESHLHELIALIKEWGYGCKIVS